MRDIPWDHPGVDDEWIALWCRAHEDMAVFDRVPSAHLIDQIHGESTRRWPRDYFGTLAEITHRTGEIMQSTGRSRWDVAIPDFATLRVVRIAVVLDHPTTIWTAFPL